MPFKDPTAAKAYKRAYHLANLDRVRELRHQNRDSICAAKRARYHRTKVLKNRWRLRPDRIAERVTITEAGCWEWNGKPRGKFGYARIQVNGVAKPAHRAVYEVLVGPVPDHLHVCHQCDNPKCVNPAHLFVGTQADNIQDMVTKGRQARGERISTAKLTAEQVTEIRRLYVPRKMGSHRLARRFGVSKVTIQRILNRKIWQHI
jgi:hypothetical protein